MLWRRWLVFQRARGLIFERNQQIALLLASVILPSLPFRTALLGDVAGPSTVELTSALERSRELQSKTEKFAAAAGKAAARAKTLDTKLQKLGRRKRELRLEMGDLLAQIGGLKSDAVAREAAAKAYKKAMAGFAAFLRTARLPERPTGMLGSVIGLFGAAPPSIAAPQERHDAAVIRAYEERLALLQAKRDAAALSPEEMQAETAALNTLLSGQRTEHDAVLADYTQTLHALDDAKHDAALNETQLRKAKAFTAGVQQDLLEMQGEMARISGRLRAKAERALVQKGLMEDDPGRFHQHIDQETAEFMWPVSGRVTAHYHEPSYFSFFGMQHQGVDIAVPQGTPVAAAADGIVFTVRLGGARGYTYVLIGHRDGYATLYGHLSLVSVRAGDQVNQGQVIGLSGATPGTEGAGPMTTGPHLHFEMILNGQHVDPQDVLPGKP